MHVKELVVPSTGTVPYVNLSSRISWGAVFSGAFVSLAAFLCLGALGGGIGLTLAPEAGRSLGIGALLWLLASAVAAFYIGGWFAGRLNGLGRVSESVLHGLVSWGLVTVFGAFLVASAAGRSVGGALGILGPCYGAGGSEGMSMMMPGETGLREAPGAVEKKLREAPAPLGEPGTRAAGTFGLFSFALIALQALAAGYGARAGTRVLRPVTGPESYKH